MSSSIPAKTQPQHDLESQSEIQIRSAIHLVSEPADEALDDRHFDYRLDPLAKRMFDVVASVVLILLLSPVYLAVAIAIKIANPRVPVISWADAVGKNRKPFREWKFSTMRPDAKEMLKEILEKDPALRAEWESTYKLKNDPRILPGIGHFLRRTSLNELPQLFNVLCGEMSLVGPRAITEQEELLYLRHSGPALLRLRYAARPGITGLWQVKGRSDTSYAERVQLDEQYMLTRNLFMDIKLIFLTVYAVVAPTGAY